MDSHLASDIRYGARHKRVILTTASQTSKTTKTEKSLKAFYRIIRVNLQMKKGCSDASLYL